jgi:enoyl-CoA hydratase
MSVVTERQDGRVSIFTINRPDKLNAISGAVALELQAKFEAFDRSDQRVAILTGAGEKAFTSGADITDIPELWRCVPTIGIAAESAVFSYPEGKVGLTGGMIAALATRIPHKLAMEIMLLGRPVKARRAYEMGLVNEVVPDGQHIDAALKMAHEMADMAPLVLSTLKRFVNEHTMIQTPSEKMARVARDLAVVRNSRDLAEGVAAFKERRKPVFEGR